MAYGYKHQKDVPDIILFDMDDTLYKTDDPHKKGKERAFKLFADK